MKYVVLSVIGILALLVLYVAYTMLFVNHNEIPQQEVTHMPTEQEPQKPAGVPTGTVATKLGGRVESLGVSLLPLQVIEDSRCPKEVQCVWEGTVRVKTQIVSGLGTSTMTLTLGTPITTEAEEVTLSAVAPEKLTTEVIPPESYVLTFVIKKRDVKY